MSVKFKFVLFLSIVLFVSLFSTVALAESSMPGMDMSGDQTMTPSEEMIKNQGLNKYKPTETMLSGDQTMTPSEEMIKNQGLDKYNPPETMLSGDQQNLMLAGVVGVFIILPVSIWIVLHQRKRARRRENEHNQGDT